MAGRGASMITSCDELKRLDNSISRQLIALDFIAANRFGVTAEELSRYLMREYGVCERTTRRDAARLIALGFLVYEERVTRETRLVFNKYKVLSRIFEKGKSHE
jgi:predicted DNA-binding transcriptional regulator YafY